MRITFDAPTWSVWLLRLLHVALRLQLRGHRVPHVEHIQHLGPKRATVTTDPFIFISLQHLTSLVKFTLRSKHELQNFQKSSYSSKLFVRINLRLRTDPRFLYLYCFFINYYFLYFINIIFLCLFFLFFFPYLYVYINFIKSSTNVNTIFFSYFLEYQSKISIVRLGFICFGKFTGF